MPDVPGIAVESRVVEVLAVRIGDEERIADPGIVPLAGPVRGEEPRVRANLFGADELSLGDVPIRRADTELAPVSAGVPEPQRARVLQLDAPGLERRGVPVHADGEDLPDFRERATVVRRREPNRGDGA